MLCHQRPTWSLVSYFVNHFSLLQSCFAILFVFVDSFLSFGELYYHIDKPIILHLVTYRNVWKATFLIMVHLYLLSAKGLQPVTDYFTKHKSIWEELDNYRPMVSCSCSDKTYHQQQDFIIRFRKGLDEKFSIVRSQVLMMEPFPTVNRIWPSLIPRKAMMS